MQALPAIFFRFSFFVVSLALGFLAMGQPIPVRAQEGAQAIEEIVVSARKREENIQDVGIAVSALGQEEIENAFARDLRDLVYVSPNLVLDDTAQGPGGVAAAYIRGIGVSEVEKNFDPAVGVVVDGIFLGTMTGGITRAIDLESVEVLRGPQGTLFGRNTIGGVVHLRRSQPTGETGGKIQASYGNYDTMRFQGLLNFGIGDRVAVKLTGALDEQNEGYYDNVNTGRDEGRVDYQSFGANVLLTPSDTVELEYTGQIERTDQDTPPLLNVGQPGQLFCDAFGSWETGETVLTDWDAVAPELFHTTRPAEYEQTSHELRLTLDDPGSRLRGTAGAYVWDSEYEVRLRSYIGFAVPNLVLDLPQTSAQDSRSWALFFEADYDLTDRLTFNFGGRYTEDEKDTDQMGIVTAAASDSWSKFTPKAGLFFHLNDDASVYGTYSVGYRSGGFNGRVDSIETATRPYDEETVTNYEVGLKSDWLGGSLRVNVAAFFMDYEDKQEELQLPSATSGTGQVTLVTNASTAEIYGLEVDTQWLPAPTMPKPSRPAPRPPGRTR